MTPDLSKTSSLNANTPNDLVDLLNRVLKTAKESPVTRKAQQWRVVETEMQRVRRRLERTHSADGDPEDIRVLKARLEQAGALLARYRSTIAEMIPETTHDVACRLLILRSSSEEDLTQADDERLASALSELERYMSERSKKS